MRIGQPWCEKSCPCWRSGFEATIFWILIVCSHHCLDAISKRSWHFLIRHLRQAPGPVGDPRLPTLCIAPERLSLCLPRADGARQLLRLRLQGHRTPWLAPGTGAVATAPARLRRTPSPASGAASAGAAQRAPPGPGGVLRLRRALGRLRLRLRRRGKCAELRLAGSQQTCKLVSKQLYNKRDIETAAGSTPQEDQAGTGSK